MPFEPFIASRFHVFATSEVDQLQAMAEFTKGGAPYDMPQPRITSIDIPGPVEPILARVYEPMARSSLRPALLWFHGGAYVFGDLDMGEADQTSREIAERANAVVVSSHYRLCSEERRFPAPQQDAWAALQWLVVHAQALGIDSERIFIGGGSAGAGLAACVATMDRDAGTHYLAGTLLVYPPVHRLPQSKSASLQECMAETPSQLQFDDEWIAEFGEWLTDSPEAEAVPCFAGDIDDLAGLPRTLIVNCEYDSLRASGERYGQQLSDAGVNVTVRLEPGVPHGHLNFSPRECLGTHRTLLAMAEFIRA